MTLTADTPTAEGTTPGGTGRVARVIGPVVDVEFPPDAMPEIYNALHVERTLGEQTSVLTLEVAQHIGDNLVRAIAMQPTDGLVRGSSVEDTGSPIMVPVGDATKGHVFNTLGQPMDVESIDVALERIGELGGATVAGKTPVGEMGFAAYVRDPEGNVIGLWETVPPAA